MTLPDYALRPCFVHVVVYTCHECKNEVHYSGPPPFAGNVHVYCGPECMHATEVRKALRRPTNAELIEKANVSLGDARGSYIKAHEAQRFLRILTDKSKARK